MPKALSGAARVAAFFATLLLDMAGILAAHIGRAAWRWLAGEFWDGFSPRYRSAPVRAAAWLWSLAARSLAARWRRPQARHALRPEPPLRPLPLHPRVQFPGIDPAWSVPLPHADLMSPAEVTALDNPPPMWRPYVDYPREGKWVA